eukprot:CAMPEP_0176128634 /NCGR_PEP_ID=MMETSP0120_2-20121206/65009_1 /TAXON_ID=160619 /ORGANISM="Kryptoperidinium foliaceum, Strain CCMP 1326" /LENGTH=32 /DNA_ID= /DNA_START= /DNA_END= /DNA_ORIENTATION=
MTKEKKRKRKNSIDALFRDEENETPTVKQTKT